VLRRAVAVLVALATVCLGMAAPAAATGSGTLFPSAATCGTGGSCRAPIEWRTDGYGPQIAVLDSSGHPTGATRVAIHRRTLFSVYAAAGEQILMGSSSIGTGNADAVVWNPGQITDTEADTLPTPQFSCKTQRGTAGNGSRGELRTRTQETKGAQSVDGTGNTTGYRPCYYTAPSSGIYRLAFYGSAGAAAGANGSPDSSITTATFAQDTADSAIDAWDVTVRAAALTSTTNIPGRVFTYVYAGFTGGNQKPVAMNVYLNTLDGYRYLVNTNGFDPNGFVFYGNRTGFVDSDGTPLNHDVLGKGSSPQSLSETVGGTSLGVPEYPLSLEPLASETLAALSIPVTPTNPTITSVGYTGKTTAKGSYVSKGGTFSFTTGTGGTYQIVISRNGTDFDPGLSSNRVLRGVVDAAGSYTVAWDGLDNARTAFPAKDGYAVQATLRGGEYHAPMIDVESSVNGGPSITLLNPPNGTCPFLNVTSTGSNCTTAFYDDRGYVSADGTTVGVVGQLLCDPATSTFYGDVPSPLFANPTTGYDSTGRQRKFGTTENKNANALCPKTGGTLGDAKGLDLWTYFPSAVDATTLDVLPIPAAPVASDDAASTPADTTLPVAAPGGLLANDTGTNLTVTWPVGATTTSAGGTVTVAADGSYTYVTPVHFSGSDAFAYTVTDDAGQKATARATITVTPKAADLSRTTTAGTRLSVAGTALAGAGTGTSISFTSVATSGAGAPAHGTVTTEGTGSDLDVQYDPAAGFSGTDSYTYTVTDGEGTTATGTVHVTVTPAAVADSASTPTGTTLHVTGSGVLANDVGTGLAATVVTSPTHGTLTLAGDGSYTYVPDAGFSGVDTFTYTATGGGGTSAPATVTLTVTPTAPDDVVSTTAGTSITMAAPGVLANDHGTGLTVSASTQPTHGSVVVSSTGGYTYTPDGGYSGPDSFTYTARDAAGSTVTATVAVTVLPVAAPHARTVAQATATTFTAGDLRTDAAGSSLTVVDHGDPAYGTVTQTGQSLTYTPTAGWSGIDTFSYTLRDAAGQETSATVTVTVRPGATDDSGTVAAGGVLAGSSVLANDAGSHLTAALATSPTHGAATVDADGTYSYVPDAGFSGADSFGYSLSGDGGSTTGTVSIVVTPTAADHVATVASGDPLDVTVTGLKLGSEGTGLTVTDLSITSATAHGTVVADGSTGWTYTSDATFSGTETLTYTLRDAHGSTTTASLTVTVTPVAAADTVTVASGGVAIADPAHGVLADDHGSGLHVTGHTGPGHGTLTLGNDGGYTYTPAAGFSGTDAFSYTVTDSSGQTATTSVTITVRPVAVDDSVATTVGHTVTGDVVANDRGTGLGVATTSLPAHGTVALASSGAYAYAPDAGFSGTDAFTYRLTGDGGTSDATVTIAVGPVAVDDAATTPAGTPYSSGSAALTDNDEGSGLTVVAHTAPSHGTLTVHADGTWRYLPDAGFSGSDAFTYTAHDGTGSGTTATVRLLVTPTAADDDYTVASTGTLTVAAADGALANDVGASTTAALLATPVLLVAGSHGTLTLAADGAFTYAPPAGFSGVDTFAYRTTGDGGTADAVIRITVTPTAPDDVVTTTAGTAVTVDAAHGVLANDAGSGLRVDSSTAPTHGTATVAADGSYTYTPDAGFSGTDTFTYTASDASQATVTATVTVTVLPRAVGDTATMPGNTTLTRDAAHGVLGDDLGSGLQVTGHTAPAHGTLTIGADGAFTYVPELGWSGTDAVTYTVTDTEGRTSAATLTITVRALVSPPAGVDDTRAGTPGGTVTLDPTANDAPGDHLTIDRGTLVLVDPETGKDATTVTTSAGTWRVLADGTVTFTPADGFSGTAHVAYRVLNSGGQTITASITVVYPAAPVVPGAPVQPDPPPHSPLASTGADARIEVLAALALVVAGGTLLVVRRRRVVGR